MFGLPSLGAGAFPPGGRGRGRAPSRARSSPAESAGEAPAGEGAPSGGASASWSAALEAAQAKAAQLRATSLGAASGLGAQAARAQAAAKAAAEHPITAQTIRTSQEAWQQLPPSARQWLPPALGGAGVALVGVAALGGGGRTSGSRELGRALARGALDDVSFLQAELLGAITEKKELTRRLLESELALAKSQNLLAAATAASAKPARR
jgi:hypothetical protein